MSFLVCGRHHESDRLGLSSSFMYSFGQSRAAGLVPENSHATMIPSASPNERRRAGATRPPPSSKASTVQARVKVENRSCFSSRFSSPPPPLLCACPAAAVFLKPHRPAGRCGGFAQALRSSLVRQSDGKPNAACDSPQADALASGRFGSSSYFSIKREPCNLWSGGRLLERRAQPRLAALQGT